MNKANKLSPAALKVIINLVTLVCLLLIWSLPAMAAITGSCSNCHTMHNSQNGVSMNFDNSTAANEGLLRGTCFGCHAQGGTQALVPVGTDYIPQVMHSEGTDLAGGNFGFITGMKGSGASNGKGHNIGPLTGTDTEMGTILPGGIQQSFHESMIVNTSNLTCAGTNGCHGYRYNGSGNPQGIEGAHHANVDGKLDAPNTVANSYRFLSGVKGIEDSDWQYTRSSSDHNEYFGMTAPVKLGCSGGDVVGCHGSMGIQSPDGTISQYCATCHGNFHTIQTTSSSGIGPDASSPFIRHPTDLVLPTTGEYSLYDTYDVNVPIARTGTLPAAVSAAVTSGSDAVICMSCHAAHATNYDDMLRWDYAGDCNVNQTSTACGCFTCHTAKDGEPTQ